MRGDAAGEGPRWHFHEEPSGTVYGNDASLFHFQGQGVAGWVRELIQNSLDAQADQDHPVEIDLSEQEVARDEVDLNGLLMTIRRCLVHSEWVGKAGDMLEQALLTFEKSESIPALRYEEQNTRGARIEDGSWDALTRAEGISGGKDGSAMGVYGIGKNAAYTASPLHAVVYVTRYTTQDMKIEHRMIGRASLSSHRDEEDRLRQPKGWLGAASGNGGDLEGQEIPSGLRRKAAAGEGTSIYILGARNLSQEAPNYLAETAVHYFPAIQQGHLTVTAGDRCLDKGTIRQHFNLKDGVSGPRALRGLNALVTGEQEETHIHGIGNVRISVRKEGEGEKPVIFLVRGAGLVITRNLTNMGEARPMVDNGKCDPYTAVIHVLDAEEGDKGWVRQCENPAHDTVSAANVLDNTMKKQARKALRELAGWAKDEIERIAARPMGDDNRNATELAHYLPTPDLFQDTDTDTDEDGGMEKGEPFAFSLPRRVNSSSKPFGVRADVRSGRKEDDPEGEERAGLDNIGTGTGRKRNGDRPVQGETSTEAKRRTIRIAYRCDRTRILPPADSETHQVRITFDAPADDSPEIRLCVIGEDGGYEEAHISKAKFAPSEGTDPEGKTIEVLEDRKGFRLRGARTGERMDVQIGLLEPSEGQAYDLVWREAAKGVNA